MLRPPPLNSCLPHWGRDPSLCPRYTHPSPSPQHFTHDVLKLFSLDCKRMSAEIFGQTMPLGKHWRLALRTGISP
ncbi:hypothetical protein JD844_025977 [Phrynosoma platyrhinos]|uniref:Coiled-coil protein 142 C-terminal domain-containing protein n=1 Tax=Phrynosoma platyrhinos TaxID=52577 RepID=A0ABQ7SED3_PHRPL|nr:hypothetical protein JD844_025977 [Phrynosoma platyrhinos]